MKTNRTRINILINQVKYVIRRLIEYARINNISMSDVFTSQVICLLECLVFNCIIDTRGTRRNKQSLVEHA